jgi:hypothetical protein
VAEVEEQLRVFIRLVEAAWRREVILYVGDDFEQAYPVRQELDRPLWLRRFLLRPDVEGWLIWQLHGYARVHGIDGGVDLDVMRASPDPRSRWPGPIGTDSRAGGSAWVSDSRPPSPWRQLISPSLLSPSYTPRRAVTNSSPAPCQGFAQVSRGLMVARVVG